MGEFIKNHSTLLTAIKDSDYRQMSASYKGAVDSRYIRDLEANEQQYRKA